MMPYITYIIMIVVTILVTSIIFTNLYAKHLYKGLRFWALGSLSLYLSYMFLGYKFEISEVISYVIGYITLMIAFVLFTFGSIRFMRMKLDLNKISIVYFIYFIAVLIFKFGFDMMWVRSILTSTLIIFLLILFITRLSKDSMIKRLNMKMLRNSSIFIISIQLIRVLIIVLHAVETFPVSFDQTYGELIRFINTLSVLLFCLSITLYLNVEVIKGLSSERNHLKKESGTDFLTGLPNRRLLYEHLKMLLDKKEKFALVICDIDDFKRINDIYGHSIGDKYILELSKNLVTTKMDIEFISRYGGDEFVIVIKGTNEVDKIKDILKQKIKNVTENIKIEKIDVKIHLSVGVSLYPETADHISQLIDQADDALYEVKLKEKGNIHIFNKTY